ncbi:MAG: TetR/AcrR family transcriptional regulator [Candidatus Dormibacteria bacterium]
MTPKSASGPRQSAEDRREEVLSAAIHEFAEHGYQAASTAAIAKRAGISQPYIYALFPNKRDLFLAVHDRVLAGIRKTFERAARGAASPKEALGRMGAEYPELISDRFGLLCQLQSYAAAGEPEIRDRVAAAFKSLHHDVGVWSGASSTELAEFFAAGMLANVTTILGLPELCAPLWAAEAPLPTTV